MATERAIKTVIRYTGLDTGMCKSGMWGYWKYYSTDYPVKPGVGRITTFHSTNLRLNGLFSNWLHDFYRCTLV